MRKNEISIFLADDHDIVRTGVKVQLEKEQGYHIVGEANDGRSAVQGVLQKRPMVVIMDINMPNLNGIEAIKQILHENSSAKIIALSMTSNQKIVTEAIKAGARGFILKQNAFEELLKAIKIVWEGRFYLSPGLETIIIEDYRNQYQRHQLQKEPSLSPREFEVLQLLVEGSTTKLIAEKIHVSIKTVETHRSHIMKKLNLHNIAALTKYAIREGIISLDE